MNLYKLEHKRLIDCFNDECIYSTITIGYYSSYNKAQETISRYINIEGFRDYQKSSVVQKLKIDKNKIIDNKIYELSHTYEDDDGYDNVTYIGVYPSIKDAYNKINIIKILRPYSEYPNNFIVDEYVINEDNWCDGFFTY